MKVETPEYYIKLLLSIYLPKKPFKLLLIDKKPKTRMGCYIINKQRIRIYTKYQPISLLKKLLFTSSLIIFMKQRKEKAITAGERECTALNFGEYMQLLWQRQLLTVSLMIHI